MDSDTAAALDAFAAGAGLVREAIRDADAGAIASRAPGETWTVRDVLNHLADAELMRAVRVRMILAEPGGQLPAWDEMAWSRRLQYLWRTPELALAQFDVARAGLVELDGFHLGAVGGVVDHDRLHGADATAPARRAKHLTETLV